MTKSQDHFDKVPLFYLLFLHALRLSFFTFWQQKVTKIAGCLFFYESQWSGKYGADQKIAMPVVAVNGGTVVLHFAVGNRQHLVVFNHETLSHKFHFTLSFGLSPFKTTVGCASCHSASNINEEEQLIVPRQTFTIEKRWGGEERPFRPNGSSKCQKDN